MKPGKGARTPRPRQPIQPELADEGSALHPESALLDATHPIPRLYEDED